MNTNHHLHQSEPLDDWKQCFPIERWVLWTGNIQQRSRVELLSQQGWRYVLLTFPSFDLLRSANALAKTLLIKAF